MPSNLPPEWARAVLPLAVLGVIKEHEAIHGYGVVQALQSADLGDVTSGTLYPLLRRVEGDGLVASEWQESVGAPPRRVYRLTRAGEAHLQDQSQAWSNFSNRLQELLSMKESS